MEKDRDVEKKDIYMYIQYIQRFRIREKDREIKKKEMERLKIKEIQIERQRNRWRDRKIDGEVER